jgi:hypothetical protein
MAPMRRFVPVLQAIVILAGAVMAPAVRGQTNHPWEVLEMAFEARGEYANPYLEGLPDAPGWTTTKARSAMAVGATR